MENTSNQLTALKSFMHWIQTQIIAGELKYNQQDAMVHFVQEGLFLVAPSIFKEFEKQHGQDGLGNIINHEMSPGSYIFKCVSQSSWIVYPNNNRHEHSVIHSYDITSSKSQKKHKIQGVVLSNPSRWFPYFQTTPHLSLSEKEHATI